MIEPSHQREVLSVAIHTQDTSAVTDAAIIERSLSEPEVFATIFDRYSDDIFRYVARRLGAEVAEDLMAETFIVAFRRRGRYDPSRPAARPWLYGIATNLIGGHKRSEARRWAAFARVPPVPLDEPVADRVADQVSAQAVAPQLAEALARLPARYRDVLLIIAWGDLDYAEAAQALGIPIGTVRSRLSRARAAVRKELRGALPDEPFFLNTSNQELSHG